MQRSAALGRRRRRRAGAMGRKCDHEPAIGLGAEGKAKPAASADALHLAAAAAGGAGHEPHALMAEYRRRIGRHHADRREALTYPICTINFPTYLKIPREVHLSRSLNHRAALPNGCFGGRQRLRLQGKPHSKHVSIARDFCKILNDGSP